MTRFLQVAGAVAWRSIHKVATTPQLLLPSIVFPMFFFVAFAGGLSNVANVPGFDFPSGYTAFQFVFVLLQASAFGGVFTGFGIASDFENGFARRLLLAAPNRLGIIAGYAISAAVRATFVGILLFAVALLTGMQVGGDGLDLFGLVVLAYPRLVHGHAVGGRRGDAPAHDAGRAAHADAGVPGPVPGAGLRPARAAVGLGPRGREGQPVHAAGRDRPRLHLRHAHPRGAHVRHRGRAAARVRALGRARPAQRRGGGG